MTTGNPCSGITKNPRRRASRRAAHGRRGERGRELRRARARARRTRARSTRIPAASCANFGFDAARGGFGQRADEPHARQPRRECALGRRHPLVESRRSRPARGAAPAAPRRETWRRRLGRRASARRARSSPTLPTPTLGTSASTPTCSTSTSAPRPRCGARGSTSSPTSGRAHGTRTSAAARRTSSSTRSGAARDQRRAARRPRERPPRALRRAALRMGRRVPRRAARPRRDRARLWPRPARSHDPAALVARNCGTAAGDGARCRPRPRFDEAQFRWRLAAGHRARGRRVQRVLRRERRRAVAAARRARGDADHAALAAGTVARARRRPRGRGPRRRGPRVRAAHVLPQGGLDPKAARADRPERRRAPDRGPVVGPRGAVRGHVRRRHRRGARRVRARNAAAAADRGRRVVAPRARDAPLVADITSARRAPVETLSRLLNTLCAAVADLEVEPLRVIPLDVSYLKPLCRRVDITLELSSEFQSRLRRSPRAGVYRAGRASPARTTRAIRRRARVRRHRGTSTWRHAPRTVSNTSCDRSLRHVVEVRPAIRCRPPFDCRRRSISVAQSRRAVIDAPARGAKRATAAPPRADAIGAGASGRAAGCPTTCSAGETRDPVVDLAGARARSLRGGAARRRARRADSTRLREENAARCVGAGRPRRNSTALHLQGVSPRWRPRAGRGGRELSRAVGGGGGHGYARRAERVRHGGVVDEGRRADADVRAQAPRGARPRTTTPTTSHSNERGEVEPAAPRRGRDLNQVVEQARDYPRRRRPPRRAGPQPTSSLSVAAFVCRRRARWMRPVGLGAPAGACLQFAAVACSRRPRGRTSRRC